VLLRTLACALGAMLCKAMVLRVNQKKIGKGDRDVLRGSLCVPNTKHEPVHC